MLELRSGKIATHIDQGIFTVTLNRPNKLNSLTIAMYQDLIQAVEYFANTSMLKVMLLEANGRAFCAGNDINDFLNADPSLREEGKLSPALQFIVALIQVEKPVIAAVQGFVTGIGTTMLLHMDLVIAADTARFHTAFIQLGLVPEAASSLLMPQLMGKQQANRLLLAGDSLNAEEAERMGLVAYVVEENNLRTSAQTLAHKISSYNGQAVKYTKALTRQDTTDIIERVHQESVLFAERMFSPETQALFKGFMNKKD